MQIGQVPVMFAPDAPVVDTTANTIPDAELQTMFPDQFAPEPIAVEPECFFCNAARAWAVGIGALVIFWAMRKPRR